MSRGAVPLHAGVLASFSFGRLRSTFPIFLNFLLTPLSTTYLLPPIPLPTPSSIPPSTPPSTPPPTPPHIHPLTPTPPTSTFLQSYLEPGSQTTQGQAPVQGRRFGDEFSRSCSTFSFLFNFQFFSSISDFLYLFCVFS